ncbi:hypothetical protein [Soonwooa sp.]|uniref:hypothetical protein n=1 Tax=Soonwooa sp. TaxID=1938592 RepID=UPI002637230A|nr:hypothetical protein [Soonwooa sp.]
MSKTYELTGGARIGLSWASYPFVSLYVDKSILKINASIVGSYFFRPEDISSIEAYTLIPILGQGIKINHKVPQYSSKIIFWTFQDPNIVLEEIKNTGFLNNINPKIKDESIKNNERPEMSGFLIKNNVAISFIILWVLLLLYDFVPFFLNYSANKFPFGLGVISALSLLFVSALLVLFSEKFRKLVFKDGKKLSNNNIIYLFLAVSGFTLISIIGMNIMLK